jgi:hypothetical protein
MCPVFDSGADPLIRAGPPGPALPEIDNSEEADEGVGCGPGGRPTKTKWHCAKYVRQAIQATSVATHPTGFKRTRFRTIGFGFNELTGGVVASE